MESRTSRSMNFVIYDEGKFCLSRLVYYGMRIVIRDEFVKDEELLFGW